jgi:dipeptidyl-peptidase 4
MTNYERLNLLTMIRNALVLALFFLFAGFPATSQTSISVEDFSINSTFQVKSITGINWMKDGKFYTSLLDNRIVKYNITSGQLVDTVFDARIFPSLEISSYSFSNSEDKILIASEKKSIYRRSFVAQYFVYDIPSRNLKKLSTNGKQSYATFSPDGTKIAFVRANNLFYVMLPDMQEVQVTDDGKFNSIINGTTDWVYEEEFGFVEAFYWSPDSKRLAYYRFNETDVKEYNLQVWGKKAYPVDYRFKYPKAGEANSIVEVWFYNLNDEGKIKADLGDEKDIYVPRVKWTNNPTLLSVRKLNRLQNQQELLHIDAVTGKASLIVAEKHDAYIDVEFVDDLYYLNDGKSFLYTSEASGFKHVYQYQMNGKRTAQVTSGDFEVVNFVGLDEKTKTLYYVSTEPSPLDRQFYSIQLDGKRKTRLSEGEGQHSINMSEDFQFYIDHHSSASRPAVASLYQTRGNKLIKHLEKNEEMVAKVKEYGLVNKEFFTFNNSAGQELHGYFLKPAGFVAGKKYPVVVYQYSGPGSQNVSNSFGGSHFYFHQMLTQAGYIVAVIDPRGTGGKGEKFKKSTYKQLGKYELEDLIEGAKYLSTLSFVDSARLGIWGWSYGGYTTALAMTKGAGTFKAGIAVSPVTNWRFYDTIYTERFLQTPQLNAAGYDDNSPLSHADKLQGKFLLIHGTGDDNVHFQNTVVFHDALIHAGKQFESFYYPDKHHGIQGPKVRFHLYTQMLRFFRDNL